MKKKIIILVVLASVVALYLGFLTRFKDTHIERKLGSGAAEAVRLEAVGIHRDLDPSKPLKSPIPCLILGREKQWEFHVFDRC